MADKAKADDKVAGDSQKIADKELDQGFVGDKVDPLPNEAHSLETGPESPPLNVKDDK